MGIRDAVLARFGLNPYGEPLLRLSFSPRLTRLIGGIWEEDGRSEYRRVQIDKREHWLLEKWFPRRTFGEPQSWYESAGIDGLLPNGPYPYRGQYLEVFRFETIPDPGLLAFSCRLAMIAPRRKASEIKAGHLEAERQKEADWERGIDDMLAGVRAGTFQLGSAGVMYDPDEARYWELRRMLENNPRFIRNAPETKFGQVEGIDA